MVLKIYYSLYGIKLHYSNVPKKVSSWNLKVFLKVFDLGAVRKAGCGHSHGCHFLADDYTDLRVSAFQSRSMSTSTVDNICPSRWIKNLVDRIVELDSKVGKIHQMLLVSLLTIMI
jgi:hypothetical protein